MGQWVNLPIDEVKVMRDCQMHTALVFRSDAKRVDFLGFDGYGIQRFFETRSVFERNYSIDCGLAPSKFVPAFIKSVKRSYLPHKEATQILLEVLRMSTLNGKELKDCSVKELIAHFNVLRKSQDKPEVGEKAFKSKGLLVKAIEELEASIVPFTPDQRENERTTSEAAEKRLSGLSDLKERKAEEAEQKRNAKAAKASTKENAMSPKKVPATKKSAPVKAAPAKAAPAKKAAPAPAKKAAPAPAKKAAKTDAPRGQGIGAYCIEQILKGKTNGEVAEAAQQKFGSNTSPSSVAWYRNKLKQEGKL